MPRGGVAGVRFVGIWRVSAIALALTGGARHLGTVCVCTLAINALSLTGPAYMLVLFDRLQPSSGHGGLIVATVAMLALYALACGADLARQRRLTAIAKRIERRLAHVSGRGLHPSERAREVSTVSGLLRGPIPAALCDAPLCPLYLAVLLAFHPLLCLLALAGAMAVGCCVLLAAGARAGAERTMLISGLLRGLRAPLQSLTLGLGAYLVMTGACHPSGMLTATILLPRFLGPIETVALHRHVLAAARQSLQRLMTPGGTAPPREGSEPQHAIRSLPATAVTIVLRQSGIKRSGQRAA